MTFLAAEWRKLILVNYAIDPAVLLPYLPAHTELDLWNGNCYVSLVGFMFKNTRMLGMKIPYHVNFPEVNLRFYVRHKHEGEWRRGVVFCKEIVPRHAITLVANTLYHEHYATRKMDYRWEEHPNERVVTYRWKNKAGWQAVTVRAALEPAAIKAGSEAEFITEHYWGYTKVNEQKTTQYEVTHPRWEQYPVKSTELEVDFGAVYGPSFAHLSQAEPVSVQLAEGSEITVKNKTTL